MAKNGSKKVKMARPILLDALQRAIAAGKADNGQALVRFSISENGYLKLNGGHREKDWTTEEIVEAVVVKPGGPGLLYGDFGIVNLGSDPFDFEINALLLLPALKKGKSDPSIIFAARNKAIEFFMRPNYRFFLMATE